MVLNEGGSVREASTFLSKPVLKRSEWTYPTGKFDEGSP